MRQTICAMVGAVGSVVAATFGGWDAAITALLICAAVDYISGCLVALVFHNSPKSETGSYNSAYGLKGLCRKGLMLLFVLVAAQLDGLMGADYIRDTVCIGFCANEVLSIIENLGLAGVPMPQAVIRALEQLQSGK